MKNGGKWQLMIDKKQVTIDWEGLGTVTLGTKNNI